MSDSNIAPKRGLPWLGDWLKEHGESKGVWQDSTTQRHEFRGFNARLVQPDNRTPLQRKADDYAGAHETLTNATMLELMSVRITARDRKRRGRIVEAWVRAQTLRRIVERVQPNRQSLNHDNYSIAMALLCREGIARPLPSGRCGYEWTEAFRQIVARAEWLVAFVRRAGEYRKLNGAQRFEVLD